MGKKTETPTDPEPVENPEQETPKSTDPESVDNPEPPKGETPSGADPLAAVAGDMPGVSEHAINAYEDREREIREKYADLRDADGNPFDPSAHLTDKNGEPVLTAKGKLRKRPGRKAGGAGSGSRVHTNHNTTKGNPEQGKQESGQPDTPPPLTPEQKAAARMAGAMAARSVITLSVGIGGEDFMPRTNPEIGMREDEYLSRAFGDYFEATGRTDFPPGMALAMALGSYWLPRATMPKTKSRFKMLGGKVYAWWHGRKAKKGKAKKGADNGPQFDPRNDGKRENNTSNATS